MDSSKSKISVVTEMLLVLKIAVACVNEIPAERPTMREVVMTLQQTRESRSLSMRISV